MPATNCNSRTDNAVSFELRPARHGLSTSTKPSPVFTMAISPTQEGVNIFPAVNDRDFLRRRPMFEPENARRPRATQRPLTYCRGYPSASALRRTRQQKLGRHSHAPSPNGEIAEREMQPDQCRRKRQVTVTVLPTHVPPCGRSPIPPCPERQGFSERPDEVTTALPWCRQGSASHAALDPGPPMQPLLVQANQATANLNSRISSACCGDQPLASVPGLSGLTETAPNIGSSA
jgi:hypothetical protein